ncbi:MAG: hypothetical protein E6J91_25060, partial [Deltaproteobacteria bacterium]
MRTAIVIGACALVSAIAHADPDPANPPEPAAEARPAPAPEPPRPIVGFAVRGDSKVQPRTVGYLAHIAVGDLVGPADIPAIQQALLSSELFTTVSVALEPAPGDPSP